MRTPSSLELINSLRSTHCPAGCGRAKGVGRSFCFKCFKALPTRMRHAMYDRIGHGYEEAMTTALKQLGVEAPQWTPPTSRPSPSQPA